MWPEFVDQTAAQDGQEYFAFIVVPKWIQSLSLESPCNVECALPHSSAEFFVRHARIVLYGSP